MGEYLAQKRRKACTVDIQAGIDAGLAGDLGLASAQQLHQGSLQVLVGCIDCTGSAQLPGSGQAFLDDIDNDDVLNAAVSECGYHTQADGAGTKNNHSVF